MKKDLSEKFGYQQTPPFILTEDSPLGAYRTEKEKHLQQRFFRESLPLSYFTDHFPKYSCRQEIARFMARNELFRTILGIQGSIVECGVFGGNGLMSWAHLSAILEPNNNFRQVIGFDTFSGFPSVHEKDLLPGSAIGPGYVSDPCYEDLKRCIELFDKNRNAPIDQPQYAKAQLIRGDFMTTGPKFLEQNQHLLLSLLFLDFDLYEPTKLALKLFLPRMAKGSLICFDQINHPAWPGETAALLESFDIKKHQIERCQSEPKISFIRL
ncbi:MAG: class I SAM-dependent methyltransferase [Oligoflexia bacterium]|nr:class I SAM-dependent methyltransferase [Oligoflexia bacterium]